MSLLVSLAFLHMLPLIFAGYASVSISNESKTFSLFQPSDSVEVIMVNQSGPYEFAGIAYLNTITTARVVMTINGDDGFSVFKTENSPLYSITGNSGNVVSGKVILKQCVIYTATMTATGFTPLTQKFVLNPGFVCNIDLTIPNRITEFAFYKFSSGTFVYLSS